MTPVEFVSNHSGPFSRKNLDDQQSDVQKTAREVFEAGSAGEGHGLHQQK